MIPLALLLTVVCVAAAAAVEFFVVQRHRRHPVVALLAVSTIFGALLVASWVSLANGEDSLAGVFLAVATFPLVRHLVDYAAARKQGK